MVIISDSPMLAGISTMLAMPAFIGSDENHKRVKVSNYKALMTKNTDDQGIASYDIQVPVSNLLLTFSCTGIQDEEDVITMANTIPVDQIVKLSQ